MERVTRSFHCRRLSCWGLEKCVLTWMIYVGISHLPVAMSEQRVRWIKKKTQEEKVVWPWTLMLEWGYTIEGKAAATRIWKWQGPYPVLELEEKTPSLRLLASKLPGNLFVVICSNTPKKLINKEYRYVQ